MLDGELIVQISLSNEVTMNGYVLGQISVQSCRLTTSPLCRSSVAIDYRSSLVEGPGAIEWAGPLVSGPLVQPRDDLRIDRPCPLVE